MEVDGSDHFPFFSWVICRFHANLPAFSALNTNFETPRKHKDVNSCEWKAAPTVDGQNPAPSRMMIIPLFTRF